MLAESFARHAKLEKPLSVHSWSFVPTPCLREPLWRAKTHRQYDFRTRVNHVNGNGASQPEESWQEKAIPSYLHSLQTPTCEDFEQAIQQAEQKASGKSLPSCAERIWQKLREEAQKDAGDEPLLSSFLYASILSHDNIERSLAFVLANRLADVTLLATELFEIFYSVLKGEQHVSEAAVSDIIAVKERDPACITHSAALLYYKGYQAIQVHRIAHTLWNRGQKVLALALQSRMSEVFAVDIHPAARIGKGVLLDHGTGVVIGETAVVGNNVSIMQNVTLGGTGKEVGDRHPKICDNVLVSAGATILGNISVGKGAQVAAGSLVLKPVPPCTMVAGSPAREVGKVTWNPAVNMQHWMYKKSDMDVFCNELDARSKDVATPNDQSGTAPKVRKEPTALATTSNSARGDSQAGPPATQTSSRSQAGAALPSMPSPPPQHESSSHLAKSRQNQQQAGLEASKQLAGSRARPSVPHQAPEDPEYFI